MARLHTRRLRRRIPVGGKLTRLRIIATAAVAAITLAAGPALATSPAPASGGDGTWRCFANGNIPIGTLIIGGDGYEFVVTRTTDFSTVKAGDPGNGTGDLAWQDTTFVPTSGPLKDSYEVTGGLDADGLSLNNQGGALMRCRRAG